MNSHLTDDDAELLLTGAVPSQRPDLEAVRGQLDAYRAALTEAPPISSVELAELMAAGGARPRSGTSTRSARRRVAAAGGVVAALVTGMGVAGVLPAAAQEVFDRVVDAVGVLDGGTENSEPAERDRSTRGDNLRGHFGRDQVKDDPGSGVVKENRGDSTTADREGHAQPQRDGKQQPEGTIPTEGNGGEQPSAPSPSQSEEPDVHPTTQHQGEDRGDQGDDRDQGHPADPGDDRDEGDHGDETDSDEEHEGDEQDEGDDEADGDEQDAGDDEAEGDDEDEGDEGDDKSDGDDDEGEGPPGPPGGGDGEE